MENKKDKFWQQFERIAYEYVKSQYKEAQVKKNRHTKASHDSGYDAIWILIPQNEWIPQTVLMEAKFRQSQKTLPLHDCAKALIIAFNLYAHQLYIVTNILFAPQALNETEKFKIRSNLEIKCINGSELKKFVQTNQKYLETECNISLDFLNYLIESLPTEPETRRKYQSIIDIKPPELVLDVKRTRLIKEIVQGLRYCASIYMIKGREGIGKSCLGKQVEEGLNQYAFNMSKVDLSLCASSRVLYINVLEAIWGVGLGTVLEDPDLEEYINQLISIGNKEMNPDILNAVKNVLLSDFQKYQGHKDYYLYGLLLYLDMILKSRKDNLKLVIYFENLHMISEEIFPFFIQLVLRLKSNCIRIILEIRTPFLIQNQSDIKLSEIYLEQLQKYSDRDFVVEPLEREASVQLIKNNTPLNDFVCECLVDYLGDNPLELRCALEILNSHPFIDSNVSVTKESLNEYWDIIGLSANSVTISFISALRRDCVLSYLFELAILFMGEIPYWALEAIWKEDVLSIVGQACESTIFSELPTGGIKCRHLRFLKAMEKNSNFNIQYKLANFLLPDLETYRKENAAYPFIELKILYILNKPEQIIHSTLSIMRDLMKMYQFKEASAAGIKCVTYIEEIFIKQEEFISDLSKILLSILMCARELHEECQDDYKPIYPKAEKYIILWNPVLDKNKLWLEYRLLIWHKFFVSGEFSRSMEVSQELYDKLEDTKNLFEDAYDFPGQVYNAYGLSTKMLKGGESAEKIFLEGIQKYQGSYYGMAALLSQRGNRLLKTEPVSATDEYLKILQTVCGKNYPYQEILHTRIDVAMSFFLSGKYTESKIWGENGLAVAQSIGIYAQAGRAYNILGCCYAAEGELQKSKLLFQESVSALEVSNATIYLWRAQLNLASVLLATDYNQIEVEELIHSVLVILKSFFKSKIQSDTQAVPYQGLLLVLMYLKEWDEEALIESILSQFHNDKIKEDFSILSEQKEWRKAFHNKVTCCNNIVLVTG